MKRYFFVYYIFLISVLGIRNQVHAQIKPAIQLNELALENMAIIQNKKPSARLHLAFNVTPAKFVATFGKPRKITKEYSEVDDYYYQVYQYEGAEFSFHNNLFINLDISGTNFSVQTQKTDPVYAKKYTFQVGDPVKKIQAAYPVSYNNKDENSIFFGLTALLPDKKTKKIIRTRVDSGFSIIYQNGRLTRFIYEW